MTARACKTGTDDIIVLKLTLCTFVFDNRHAMYNKKGDNENEGKKLYLHDEAL